nr:hypothetical protein BaRGS_027405 [Batillaria attramentaria]
MYGLCTTNKYYVIHIGMIHSAKTIALSDQMRFLNNITSWQEKKPALYHGHMAFIDYTKVPGSEWALNKAKQNVLRYYLLDIFAKFVRGLQDNGEQLQDKIRKQLEAVCDGQPPTLEKNGILMCELLELVLLWTNTNKTDAKALLSLLDLFKKHGFGVRQNVKHLIDETTEKYIKRISLSLNILSTFFSQSTADSCYLEALIVLEAIDVENAMICCRNDDLSDYTLAKTDKDFQGDGLWLLFESAMSYFPLNFSRFMNLTVALASASPESAARVKGTLRELSVYTEYLDNNSARDLQVTPDDSVFRLTSDKHPYPSGALERSAGMQLSGPLMRWEVRYNSWALLISEVHELLRQVAQGAGMVQPTQVERVTTVMELVQEVLKADPTATEEFAPFFELSYQVVHR